VAAGDFAVTIGGSGVTVAAAEHFSGANTSVFLTVPTMATNDTPVVTLVGSVSDKAGNASTASLSGTASDGVAPGLTVTLSATLTKTDVTITVASDEPLLTAPTITVDDTVVSATPAGTNTWTATGAGGLGIHNVEVSGRDATANTTTSGVAAHDTSGAIVYEVDNQLPDPVVKAGGTTLAAGSKASVYSTSPFIDINWAAEANEYGLDAVAGNTTTTVAGIVVDLDSHNTVSLSVLTLDGTDSLSSAQANDAGNGFILATAGLALGDHTLIFNATDDATNTLSTSTSITFTVKEKAAFTVDLVPGWNLVSLPDDPIDDAINSVITVAAVDKVVSYDPSAPDKWLTARRGSDGTLGTAAGDNLSTFSGRLAYWVHTSSFEDLSVTLQSSAAGASNLPPTLNLAKGWNMVPVLDVSGTSSNPTASNYLQSLDVGRIYKYNITNDRLDSVATTDALEIGIGYFVYLNAAGTLVP
jgi:hypothetical protein